MYIFFRYEDFFGGKKKKPSKKSRSAGGSKGLGTDDEQEDDEAFENQVKIIAFCQLLLRVLGPAVRAQEELLVKLSLTLIVLIVEAK